MSSQWNNLVLLSIASLFGGACACPGPIGEAPIPDSGIPDAGTPTTKRSDFPAAPFMDGDAPTEAPTLFGEAGASSGGPCLLEPQLGSLHPPNGLRPRFEWASAANENFFELRLSSEQQVNELVVYTTLTSWTMPENIWQPLSQYGGGLPISVRVRGAVRQGNQLSGSPALGSSGVIHIAPVSVSGSIAYWTTKGASIKGFFVGKEPIHEVLTAGRVSAGCIGCHSSTPDGDFVAYSATPATDAGLVNGTIGHIELRSYETNPIEPGFLTPSARSLLSRSPQHFAAFSPARWTTGDRILVSMLFDNNSNKANLIWTNLEAASSAQGVGWDYLARNGDTNGATYPAFSHDGARVAYASSTGRPNDKGVHILDGDLYTVAFPGGTASPLAGASEANVMEYYPTFSPDDEFIAYTRAKVSNGIALPDGGTHRGHSDTNPGAEVFVVSSDGGQAHRIVANDPPACASVKSPGVGNSWPKWAPEVATVGDRTYYWLTFSSYRKDGMTQQLYFTALVVHRPQGLPPTVESYPAVRLWNQPEDQGNHTPAWDTIDLPLIQ